MADNASPSGSKWFSKAAFVSTLVALVVFTLITMGWNSVMGSKPKTEPKDPADTSAAGK